MLKIALIKFDLKTSRLIKFLKSMSVDLVWFCVWSLAV